MDYPKEVVFKGGDVDNALEINALLDIVHKTKDLPKLSAIGGAALLELEGHNKLAQVRIDEYNEEVKKRDAEIARIKAEVKEEEEEEAKPVKPRASIPVGKPDERKV